MRIRANLLLAAGLLLLLPGMKCNNPVVTFVFPGNVVTTFDVAIRVRVSQGFVPTTATLNGQPITLEKLGSTNVYTTTVYPGPLLTPTGNVLVVNAEMGASVASGTRTFDYTPPLVRAVQVSEPHELIEGPAANSRIGDYLIENAQARFIIQNAPVRDLTGVASFGGNIIDAEVRGRPGRDNFIEIQPALNVETVVHATTVEIVNDGSDDTAAIIRACGPDDLIDYINASTLVGDFGASFPSLADDNDQPVTACTEYKLEPGNRHLEVTTTVENESGTIVGMYVGDYVNGGGEMEQWTSNTGTDLSFRAGIGELFATTRIGLMSFFGFGEAEGVDYTIVSKNLLPGPSGMQDSSSFTTSGVSYVMHSHSVVTVLFLGFGPVFNVPASGSASFKRFFGVGDGSGANGVEIEIAVEGLQSGTLQGCVTVGGQPAPGARISAGPLNAGLTEIQTVAATWVTGDDGCYGGPLPLGTYGVVGGRLGTPYEGGGSTALLHTTTLDFDGEVEVVDVALPATGRVHVDVVDSNNDPVPARIGVVGFDPSPEKLFSVNLSGLNVQSNLLHEQVDDPIPFGLTWVAYAGADGAVEFDLEPGTYEVVVSRGTEWSAFQAPLVVTANNTTNIAAQIHHVVDSTGFISSDFHVHQIPSSDSRIAFSDRVMQFAGEGVDNIVATDHDRHTDLNPSIAALGLTPFVFSTIGEEITSFDYGHFNAYPLGIDPDRVTGGSTDWAGAPPGGPGKDFTTSTPPSYTLKPSEIAAAVVTGTKVAGGLINPSPNVAVQVNHISSHFEPLKIDTSLEPPQSLLSDAERLARRFDPGDPDETTPELFHPFKALELWNGYTRSQLLDEFVDDRIGIWMNLLNQGIATTAIADTDTHEFFNTRAGGARSWTPSSSDAPAAIDPEEVGAAVNSGRVVGGQGVYVQTRLVEDGNPGNAADMTLGGSTLVTVTSGTVNLEIHVQAPTWAPFDRIQIHRNAPTLVLGPPFPASAQGVVDVDPARGGGIAGVLYKVDTRPAFATSITLNAGTDFTVNTVPGFAGGQRLEAVVTLPLTVGAGQDVPVDTWFVVVARGTDGVSQPMFPVMPASLNTAGNTTLANLLDGNLNEGGVPAFGFTNALYLDVDGNAQFDPPGVSATLFTF